MLELYLGSLYNANYNCRRNYNVYGYGDSEICVKIAVRNLCLDCINYVNQTVLRMNVVTEIKDFKFKGINQLNFQFCNEIKNLFFIEQNKRL